MVTLTRPESERILGYFTEEARERIHTALMVATINEALRDGRIDKSEFLAYCLEHEIPFMAGGANGFYITNAEAISMLTDFGVGVDAGTAAVIQGYAGSVPADADAANGGTLLFTCTCSATAFTSITDGAPGAVATFAAITDDSSADATGTLTFFRISTQSAGTVVAQGTAGTASADLIMNTVSITSGSTVTIDGPTSTITLPEGP